MERQLKKRRLNLEDPNSDLNSDLHEQRARNDLHLKSRFEAIFEKYGKDFSEVGDEIDLETGKIVVDKGHIQRMAHEQDTGQDINPSSQQKSEYWSALSSDHPQEYYSALENNPSYEPRKKRSLDPSVREMTDSAGSSDDDMANSMSKPARFIQGQTMTSKSAPPSCHYAYQKHKCPGQRYTNPVLHDKTPLRRLEVDHISNRLSIERRDMYHPPIEPAWQAPPLPIDRSTQFQRPNVVPILLEQREYPRSPSPPAGSLWAPLSGSGRYKIDGKPGFVQKPKASTRRASMPAFRTNKLGNTPRKEQRSSTSIKRTPIKHSATVQACAKLWTSEEKNLLRQLRTSTDLTYAQMTSYFPGRSWIEIECSWLLIAGSEETPKSTPVKTCTGPKVQTTANKNFVRVAPGSVAQGDEEVDELQLYDFGFQTAKPVLPQQEPQTQSPPKKSPPSKSPMSSRPITTPRQQDSDRNEYEDRVDVLETEPVPLEAPPLIYKVNPQVQIQSRRESPKTPPTVLDLASAASGSTSVTPRTGKKASRLRKPPQPLKASGLAAVSTPVPSRSGKQPGISRKAAACPKLLTSVVTSYRPVTTQTMKKPSPLCRAISTVEELMLPVDDSSEDELANPKQLPEKLSVTKISVAKSIPGSSKTQTPRALNTPSSTAKSSTPIIYQIDDVSDDELSTPFNHGALVLRLPTKVPVSTRRRTSIW